MKRALAIVVVLSLSTPAHAAAPEARIAATTGSSLAAVGVGALGGYLLARLIYGDECHDQCRGMYTGYGAIMGALAAPMIACGAGRALDGDGHCLAAYGGLAAGLQVDALTVGIARGAGMKFRRWPTWLIWTAAITAIVIPAVATGVGYELSVSGP